MIRFEQIECKLEEYRDKFSSAVPFEHVVIDGFCDEARLAKAVAQIPSPEDAGVRRSRDFIFAKNKFEQAEFQRICPEFDELKSDLLSERFAKWLSSLVGQEVFVDPTFHGGGLHQGGHGSFLDMHVDFNFHPRNPNWFRNVNILLYLNAEWEMEFKGELKLADGRGIHQETVTVDPLFNRAVIMFTREYTLHGYDPIQFPDGRYRRSIAAYGYTLVPEPGAVRTTVWYPQQGGSIKRWLGKHMPRLVRLKAMLLGSGTEKNK